jgi:hypothetical protein
MDASDRPFCLRGCVDCGSILDYYMVFDKVWRKAGLADSDRCCLTCLEWRLGRPLSIDDFPPLQVNRMAYAAAGRLSTVGGTRC